MRGTERGERELRSSTRQRLLDAAEQLFAEAGFRRVSVRAITAAAGCNLAAVNYHFGGKAGLYREVFARRLASLRDERLRALERARARAAGDLAAALTAFAEAFLAPLCAGPGGRVVLQLIAREMADPQLPAGFFRDELVIPANRALSAAVAAAAPELSARTVQLCVQSFVGQLLHVLHAHQFAAVKAVPSPTPFSIAELTDHIVRFTVAAIDHLRQERTHEARPVVEREGGE